MRPIHTCWKLSAFTGNALNTSAHAASQARNSGRRYSAITQRYAYTTRSNGAGYGECAGYKFGGEVTESGAGMAGAGQMVSALTPCGFITPLQALAAGRPRSCELAGRRVAADDIEAWDTSFR